MISKHVAGATTQCRYLSSHTCVFPHTEEHERPLVSVVLESARGHALVDGLLFFRSSSGAAALGVALLVSSMLLAQQETAYEGTRGRVWDVSIHGYSAAYAVLRNQHLSQQDERKA